MFAGKLAEKIPVVKQIVGAGDRAMTAYLTRLRADVFDDTLKGWGKAGITPETHPEEFRSLATFLNTATGRGGLGPLEPHAETLAKVFSSPRLASSRVSMINPKTYIKMPPAARKIAIRDALAFAGTNATLLTLAGLAGQANKDSGISATMDARSSDFGKVVLGKSRLDMSAGISPWLRMIAQTATAKKVVEGKEKDASRLGTVAQFARGRLAPIPSLLVDTIMGTTMDGQPFDPASDIGQKFIPLFAQDFTDAVQEHGVVPGSLLGLAAYGGLGVQTYKDKGDTVRHAMQSTPTGKRGKPTTNRAQRARGTR